MEPANSPNDALNATSQRVTRSMRQMARNISANATGDTEHEQASNEAAPSAPMEPVNPQVAAINAISQQVRQSIKRIEENVSANVTGASHQESDAAIPLPPMNTVDSSRAAINTISKRAARATKRISQNMASNILGVSQQAAANCPPSTPLQSHTGDPRTPKAQMIPAFNIPPGMVPQGSQGPFERVTTPEYEEVVSWLRSNGPQVKSSPERQDELVTCGEPEDTNIPDEIRSFYGPGSGNVTPTPITGNSDPTTVEPSSAVAPVVIYTSGYVKEPRSWRQEDLVVINVKGAVVYDEEEEEQPEPEREPRPEPEPLRRSSRLKRKREEARE